MLPEKYVITVGRSFGSGGRALGKLIADKLGIEFYDKKLLVKAAEKAGYNLEYFEKNEERAPSIMGGIIPFSMGYYPMSWIGDTSGNGSDAIYRAQSEFIHELAADQPCVIVGRSSDYILRDVDNVVNIFVHAPIDACVDRIVERGECADRNKARVLAERTNKLRANFYNFYTDRRWGHADTYDLCVDSSKLPLEQLADYVIDYVKLRLDK
ncbi:MAG: cytidylate kinase-like family protein [Bacteroidales bacterium]|nr:cytidylate kinase-like family protein [Bacteroidales bacterium]MBD5215093.1 cytidylate kinase-like family protein [Bacteroidales bacterium]MBD5219924.1 cytidylate kinase-like family protein [Bacteroidales bacterium]